MTSEPHQKIPQHIAIIMDGNGRWAKQRHLPRTAGHKSGVKTLRRIVEHAMVRDIGILTVYAFSSENWNRPQEEVRLLMELFMSSLKEEVKDLHENGVSLRFIGNMEAFPEKLRSAMGDAQSMTVSNSRMILNVAANYGGRWDIVNACRKISAMVEEEGLKISEIDEDLFNGYLSLSDMPPPDLFIRTGGEKRISNYLLWQLAYTELYFTGVLWPDFDTDNFDEALAWYSNRQRRYGRTSDQLREAGA